MIKLTRTNRLILKNGRYLIFPKLKPSGNCYGFSVTRIEPRQKITDLPPRAIVVTAQQLDEMTRPFDL
jgi:hypothetical protein